MNEPVKAKNALELPSGMAPRPVAKTDTNIVDSTGQLNDSLTLPKKDEKGTALSRASAQ